MNVVAVDDVPVAKIRSLRTEDELKVVFAVVSMHRDSTSRAKSSLSSNV
jgi:hypothetical protein